MPSENLTPQELTYLRRLWQFQQQGTLDRRYKVIMTVAVSVTILLFAIPLLGIPEDWSRMSVWTLGLLTGFFWSVAMVVTLSKKRWVIIAPFIDWNRIEAIANRGEN